VSQQGVNVLVLSATDPNALCGAVNEAQAAGVKVVTYDADTKPGCRDLFINQADVAGIGAKQIELISKAIGPDGGEIAILSATSTATNQNAWIEAMKTTLAKPEYAKLKLVDTVYGDDNDAKSFAEAQGLLAKHPNLKGIISPTTVGISAGRPLPVRLEVQGQGAADRSRHAEPDAQLRQGRHLQVVRPVEPGRPRLPGRVRRRGTRLGRDHRQGGRQVQGRQAR
jgi:ABC-type sugar transport system substrate-binding protein